MNSPYEDIMYLPHPDSPKRKRMSMIERAAQFSPFAALTGYDAAIRETGRLTDQQVELDVDEKAVLNERFRHLALVQEEHPEISVTCFVPDERKNGGAYIQITDRVKRVDPYAQAIVMKDGTLVYFSRIRDIWGEIFQQYEGLYFFE